METDPTLTRETLETFSQALGVPSELLPEHADVLTLDDVRRFLIPRIAALLDGNPAMLMHILYRVDVAEQAVKQVFAESAPADVPLRLADLLIERQMQKLRTRRRYRDPEA